MSLLSMSLTGAAMVVAVIVARALLLHRLPKMTFVILWALVALRLLVPVSVPVPVNAYSLFNEQISQFTADIYSFLGLSSGGAAVVAASPDASAATDALTETAGSTASTAGSSVLRNVGATGVPGVAPGNVPTGVSASKDVLSGGFPGFGEFAGGLAGRPGLWVALWAAGALVCAAGFAVPYVRSRRLFATSLPVEDAETRALFAETCADLRIGRPVDLRQSGLVDAPLTYGALRPVVLVPKPHGRGAEDVERTRFVLVHELTHVRHCDVAFKFVLAAAACLHWFNPFVWVMWMLAARDIELSCDEAVVRSSARRSGGDARADYARALISMEETKSGLAPLCSAFNKTAIEERIVAIMKVRKSSFAAVIASSLLVVGIPAAFASTAMFDLGNGSTVSVTAIENGTAVESVEGDVVAEGGEAAEAAEEDAVGREADATSPSTADEGDNEVTRLLATCEGFGLNWAQVFAGDKDASAANVVMFYNGKPVRSVRDLKTGAGLVRRIDYGVDLVVVYGNDGKSVNEVPVGLEEGDASFPAPATEGATAEEGETSEAAASADSVASSEGAVTAAESEEGIAEQFAGYKGLGLTFDAESGLLYYNQDDVTVGSALGQDDLRGAVEGEQGLLVGWFIDVQSADGETTDVFSYSVGFGTGLKLRTVYDENGKLGGLETFDEVPEISWLNQG